MNEYRCPGCGKFLMLGQFTGWIEVFCGRCKRRRRFDVNATYARSAPERADERAPRSGPVLKGIGYAAERGTTS